MKSSLAAHQAGALISANTLGGLVDSSAPVYAGGTDTDDGLLMTTTAGTSDTLGRVGFEGGGAATIRFSYEGGAFQNFDSANGDAYMVTTPEPGTAVLLVSGRVPAARRARRSDRRRTRAGRSGP